MAQAPIKIIFYDPETNEVIKEHTTHIIPTGIFTELVRLHQMVDLQHAESLQNINPETIESIQVMVVALFGNRFTLDELKNQTELGEFSSLIQNLWARVAEVMPQAAAATGNPTKPGQTRKRPR